MARKVIQHVINDSLLKACTIMAIERNENRSEYINIAIENQLRKDRKKFLKPIINNN